MSGAGNDFIVIDNRQNRITNRPALASKLCNRRWGIGADGLLLVESSKKASYRMMYYNSDGSYGGMCGNGARCIALYATTRGIARRAHSFEALDFVYHAQVRKTSVTLTMKNPSNLRMNLVLPILRKKVKAHFVDTGSPHVVIPVTSLIRARNALQKLQVDKIGPPIRYHRQFKPSGTNVNFIYRLRPNSLKMRTYERGVEAETLACGTGSIACALISSRLWNMKPPITVVTQSNKKLVVNFTTKRQSIRNVTLSGPALVVFDGVVEV